MSTFLLKLKLPGFPGLNQASLTNQLAKLAYERFISLTQDFGSVNGCHYTWHVLNRRSIPIPRIKIRELLK